MEKNFEPTDLVYQFNLIDAVQIQQMLIALKRGYELKAVLNSHGFVEFILSYEKDKKC